MLLEAETAGVNALIHWGKYNAFYFKFTPGKILITAEEIENEFQRLNVTVVKINKNAASQIVG